MHTPMPLGKGQPMKITTSPFVDDSLKERRKQHLKKSPSSKIGLTSILKILGLQVTQRVSSCWLT